MLPKAMPYTGLRCNDVAIKYRSWYHNLFVISGNLLTGGKRFIFIFITLKLKSKWNQVNSFIGE
jgi:hypothetical protein